MILGYPQTLGTGTANGYPFNEVFTKTKQVSRKEILNGDVDAVVIWGGADISPSLYGATMSRHTFAHIEPSTRDVIEKEVFEAAVEKGIPILGICRGAQLACALSGGILVQHVTGHHGNHGMRTTDGQLITTTSVHHQMMYPFQMDLDSYNLLAWANKSLSSIYAFNAEEEREAITLEPEVVYFRNTKALAIQGHPEFTSSPDNPFVQYVLDLTRQLMAGTL